MDELWGIPLRGRNGELDVTDYNHIQLFISFRRFVSVEEERGYHYPGVQLGGFRFFIVIE